MCKLQAMHGVLRHAYRSMSRTSREVQAMRTCSRTAVVVMIAACGTGDTRPELSLEEPAAIPQHCDLAAPPPGVATVQVVFSCDEAAVGSWRALPAGVTDTLRFALDALLRGPGVEEIATGLSSFFSHETAGMLNSVEVRDGVAFIDFRDFSGVIPNASASAGSAQLLDQIAGTVFQFEAVREAALSFDGSCDAFWNWLQRDCERLLRGEP
jgi:hypothetical protein